MKKHTAALTFAGLLALAGAGALAAAPSAPHGSQDMQETTTVKRMTTVIFVDEVEPALDFWIERLGFEITAKVPEDGGPLVFAMLGKDGTEVMYQTLSSIDGDAPQVRPFIKEPSSVSLFIEVESLDAFKPGLEGIDYLVEERTTFYGAREITVLAPCGTPVTLAEFGAP